jgi:hypothetical protein
MNRLVALGIVGWIAFAGLGGCQGPDPFERRDSGATGAGGQIVIGIGGHIVTGNGGSGAGGLRGSGGSGAGGRGTGGSSMGGRGMGGSGAGGFSGAFGVGGSSTGGRVASSTEARTASPQLQWPVTPRGLHRRAAPAWIRTTSRSR